MLFYLLSFLLHYRFILHLTDRSHEIIWGFVLGVLLIAVWNLCFQRRGPLGTIWDLLLKTNWHPPKIFKHFMPECDILKLFPFHIIGCTWLSKRKTVSANTGINAIYLRWSHRRERDFMHNSEEDKNVEIS